MPPAQRLGLTTGTPEPEGAVAGALLRLIRSQLGLNQEQAAEALKVDPNTIKSWETGRRPLARVSVQTLRSIMRTLNRLGADAALLDQLNDAIDVDLVIAQILAGGHAPHDHPLGTLVHNRAWHDLLSWAVTGSTPAALRGVPGTIPRPRLATPDRARLFDSLRTTADQAGDDPAATLLRRQVYFVGAWDDSSTGRDWLNRMEQAELRQIRRGDDWTPAWVAGRSIAVARACQGDPDQLRQFIREQLATDRQEAANLNYWAYWCGEQGRPAISDEFMAASDLGAWRGDTLLRHLTAGLTATTPYVELTIHTVWALLHRRPWLLGENPGLATDLHRRIGRLLADAIDLSPQARGELQQLEYATAVLRGKR